MMMEEGKRQAQSNAELSKAMIANRPPVIVKEGGGGCNMF